VRGLLLGLALILCAACGSATDPSAVALLPAPAAGGPLGFTPAGVLLVPYTDPPRFTGRYGPPGSCQARGPRPDPICTPGSVGATDPTEVCAHGFATAHRPPPDIQFRVSGMRAYGIPGSACTAVQADQLVPGVLGGSNDATNIWLARSDIPGGGIRNTKDRVEARVLAAVCKPRSTVPLGAAQAAFAHDWTTASAALGIRP